MTYINRARTILGQMKDNHGKDVKVQYWNRKLPDGTIIETSSVNGLDRIQITPVVVDTSGVAYTEYMYYWVQGASGVLESIWAIDRNGGDPISLSRVTSLWFEFGINLQDPSIPPEGPVSGLDFYYTRSSSPYPVLKNNSTLVSSPLPNGHGSTNSTTNSTHLLILDDDFPANVVKYDLAGNYVSEFESSPPDIAETHIWANDKVVITGDGGDDWYVQDVNTGDLLGISSNTFWGIGGETNCIARDVFMIHNTNTGTTNHYRVYNNLVEVIGNYSFSGESPTSWLGFIGITSDRVYVQYLRSVGLSTIEIYEHTLTIVKGVATTAVLGNLLHTVDLPYTPSGYTRGASARAHMNSSLFNEGITYDYPTTTTT